MPVRSVLNRFVGTFEVLHKHSPIVEAITVESRVKIVSEEIASVVHARVLRPAHGLLQGILPPPQPHPFSNSASSCTELISLLFTTCSSEQTNIHSGSLASTTATRTSRPTHPRGVTHRLADACLVEQAQRTWRAHPGLPSAWPRASPARPRPHVGLPQERVRMTHAPAASRTALLLPGPRSYYGRHPRGSRAWRSSDVWGKR